MDYSRSVVWATTINFVASQMVKSLEDRSNHPNSNRAWATSEISSRGCRRLGGTRSRDQKEAIVTTATCQSRARGLPRLKAICQNSSKQNSQPPRHSRFSFSLVGIHPFLITRILHISISSRVVFFQHTCISSS